MAEQETIVIARRFQGPPDSANGGYVAGLLAQRIQGDAEVRLHAPPALDRELRVEMHGRDARLVEGDTLVAVARPVVSLETDVPPSPSFDEAEHAARGYAGFEFHPLPDCFVCGPGREAGDGLRIFATAITAREIVAAPWTPHGSLAGTDGYVRPEFLWAALDCPGVFVFDFDRSTFVLLGTLAVRIAEKVRPGERCVVTGWALGSDGRKHYAGTAIFSERGELKACAKATWIELARRP
jgi:hypothetical protein